MHEADFGEENLSRIKKDRTSIHRGSDLKLEVRQVSK